MQGAWLMARRSAQSVLKRAREQALREKRELKQAKKDARRRGVDPSADVEGTAPEEDAAEGDAAEEDAAEEDPAEGDAA
jgi:hypothetical protein